METVAPDKKFAVVFANNVQIAASTRRAVFYELVTK
jgi:hypothetical protein